ncbi:DNA circularization N-terminal domain-containing protein [Rhodopseudomonas sp. B29]|uniref:DNA circularization N-terminal domain-containing protein n=1 Tax=Rhodopseudomonas sp. B29 TaxID=95607 RepID=UPI00034CDE35|nr:DNA circularization N-terminal domain-containing protein [Rhodopseudomonas sp. B29]
MDCRDWLSTLWPASFKGVPFYFEQDKEEGGRDLVVHVFPNRDDPFVEDMGEAPRTFAGSAYVHGDDADQWAATLKSALASRGAGVLVVPYFGPVTVHCQTFERATARDQMGYVAFEIKFVRKGAASAIVSVPLLQTVAFAAADNVAAESAGVLSRSVALVNQPDYVVAAASTPLANAAAMLDVLRQSYPTDPAVSAKVRDDVVRLLGQIDDAFASGAASDVAAAASNYVGTVRALADAMPAASAVRAMSDMVESFTVAPPTNYLSASQAAAAANEAAASRMVRLAALTAYAEAVLRTVFVARPDGVTARGEVAERFESELLETYGAADAALYVAIERLRGSVIEWLSQTIANLASVVTVESVNIRPSLALAWILYADASRAPELVARNRVRHPSFMPREIEALSR